jgi:hypothetical protein
MLKKQPLTELYSSSYVLNRIMNKNHINVG